MGRRPPRFVAIVVTACTLYLWTISHTIEDFLHDVPEERFHLPELLALWGSGPLFALPAAGIGLLALGYRRPGLLVLAFTGAGWFIAASADHAWEIIDQPYREGFSSTVWVLGMILNGAALAWLSVQELRSGTDRD